MSTIERAIEIAAKAHAGVVDKAGSPYVFHPLRMMLSMSTTEERIVAILHDVVEDSKDPHISLDDLRSEGFSEEVILGVDSVTQRENEDYEASIRRAGRNPIGRRVKLADLRDNSDLSRISNPTERDFARLEKYKRAYALLTGPEFEPNPAASDGGSLKKYQVFVDDNFHYMDEDERYLLGEFETGSEAIAASQRIVDEFLHSTHRPGMAAEELYRSYTMFGEDPFIVSNSLDRVGFSAWGYAKERCQQICSNPHE
ncbi:MAG: hypothetical protein K1X53_11305 [Candidatus Sumerlaeaceae bacterium]|nr:hypothetical protein [Candidatus Sumerlaeaceae bacterium]